MSGSATLDLERLLLEHTLAIAPMPTLSRVYVALCRTAPTEATGGVEASGGGYVRGAATFTLLATPANAAANATAVEFLPATSDWGTVTHFEIWTQATGGTRLYWGQLIDPADGTPIEIEVAGGNVLRFSPGSLVVQAADMDPLVGAPWLPTTGGTMTGPLYYTATGGTTSRSAQDRAADVSNVLDFGADPTGVLDSAPAINAAAAIPTAGGGRLKAVYLPAGIYLIKSQIVLNKGQAFYGDAQGASVLQVDGRFDPAATSVIVCVASSVDPGPTIRNLYIYFVQPNDVASRATFKTLAAGGTSGLGGTGVQYPWAIATNGNSGRIQVQSVCITGAWNGINADAACFWIDGLKISAFNIGIAIGGTVAAGVLDWAFVSNVEFWNFGLNTAQLQAVRGDGQTIAMRIGCQNGLVANNIACFTSKIIFTADAVGGWFTFTNLLMDAAFSTISILAAYFLQITNLYSTAGANGIAPAVSTLGAAGGAVRTVSISNWYAHSSSPFPMLTMSGGGDFNITNAYLIHTLTTQNITRTTAGILRLSNSRLYAANSGAWTVPLVYQNNTGSVQISNVQLGSGSSSGTAIQINQDNAANTIGFVQLDTGWTNSIVSRANGLYGPWASTASPTFTGGIVLGPAGPTIRSGTGAATGTQPKGSQWIRTDGAVGSTLYVSQGGGTWNAVAGV